MNVMILDDHPLIGHGLRTIVSSVFQDSLVFTESSVTQAVERAKETAIDLSIVDLNLNGESGLDFIKKCTLEKLSDKCMVLTSSRYGGDFRKALDAGVDGYILKDCMPEDMIYALKVVSKGKKYIDPHFMKDQYSPQTADKLTQLTDREHEILDMLGKGLTNTEISETLFISVSTVKKHINHIFSKMEFRNRADAILYCMKSM